MCLDCFNNEFAGIQIEQLKIGLMLAKEVIDVLEDGRLAGLF